MRAVIREQLDAIKEAGTYKNERVITSPQGASIRVQGSSSGLLNFCANNYLGLSVGTMIYLDSNLIILHVHKIKNCSNLIFFLILMKIWEVSKFFHWV